MIQLNSFKHKRGRYEPFNRPFISTTLLGFLFGLSVLRVFILTWANKCEGNFHFQLKIEYFPNLTNSTVLLMPGILNTGWLLVQQEYLLYESLLMEARWWSRCGTHTKQDITSKLLQAVGQQSVHPLHEYSSSVCVGWCLQQLLLPAFVTTKRTWRGCLCVSLCIYYLLFLGL